MDKRIRELARENVTVNHGLSCYDMGHLSAQEALISIVLSLADHNQQLVEKCKELAMTRKMTVLVKSLDQIVGLNVEKGAS
jgi:hypothetical protein